MAEFLLFLFSLVWCGVFRRHIYRRAYYQDSVFLGFNQAHCRQRNQIAFQCKRIRFRRVSFVRFCMDGCADFIMFVAEFLYFIIIRAKFFC